MHVGALALSGEIAIREGRFDDAAALLTRLAAVDGAPARNRVTAAITAVDLLENKLSRSADALAVLQAIHHAGLSTLPIRERLARTAARVGEHALAVRLLESLMFERKEPAAQLEAASLALALATQRLGDRAAATRTAARALALDPLHEAASAVLLAGPPAHAGSAEDADIRALFTHSFHASAERCRSGQFDGKDLLRAGHVARFLGKHPRARALYTLATTLQTPGVPELPLGRAPGMVLSSAAHTLLAGTTQFPAFAQLCAALTSILPEVLGPSLAASGIGKKDRVEPRTGLALRTEVAAVAGALGIAEFELYIGGRDDNGISVLAGEMPKVIAGAAVKSLANSDAMAALAAGLWAYQAGVLPALQHEDAMLGALLVAASNFAKVPISAPTFAAVTDVERNLSKAIARKTKAQLPELCAAVARYGPLDTRSWTQECVLRSQRIALVFSGNFAAALRCPSSFAAPRSHTPALLEAFRSQPGAAQLVDLLFSDDYDALRRALALEPAP
jgi:cellulose synthase operon protein C